jgi:hypothetical protein
MQELKNLMILQENSYWLLQTLLKIFKKTEWFTNQICLLKKWKILPKSIFLKIKSLVISKTQNLKRFICNSFKMFANMLLLNYGASLSLEKWLKNMWKKTVLLSLSQLKREWRSLMFFIQAIELKELIKGFKILINLIFFSILFKMKVLDW